VETEPVPAKGDAADDPAIWVHPTDPDKSLVLGTNKAGGLCVYDLSGKLIQVVGDGQRPNNVDVLYGLATPTGEVDLAVVSVRSPKAPGVQAWRIEARTGRLAPLGGVLPVFGGAEPYGLCCYRSGVTGKSYFVVNSKSGEFEQHELILAGGKLTSRVARRFAVKTQPEGCVADDELGHLYVGEEDVGVWKLPAEPVGEEKMRLIARVGENGLAADVEGLALYGAAGGRGYLIVSSQGNDTFKVYRRDGDNAFVGTIDPSAGRLGKVSETDGIAVTSAALGGRFPKGLFVAQDGKARYGAKGNQNFKLFAWEDVAGGLLRVDPSWSPRGQPRRR
jgi:3-phytase